MQLPRQIKKHREIQDLSQEALAQKIFVSRQTISNWETGKSYPDIQNLLLLSDFFDVSLDDLVKGDIQTMKKMLDQNIIKQFNLYSILYQASIIITILTMAISFHFFNIKGLFIGLIPFLVTIYSAIKVEGIKEKYHLQTYQEIIQFIETGDYPDQKVEMPMGKKIFRGAFLGLCAGISAFLVTYLLNYLLDLWF